MPPSFDIATDVAQALLDYERHINTAIRSSELAEHMDQLPMQEREELYYCIFMDTLLDKPVQYTSPSLDLQYLLEDLHIMVPPILRSFVQQIVGGFYA